jgi:hypothetical protein
MNKVNYHIQKLERKYADKFPKIKGYYILNIDPEIDKHFILTDSIPETESKTKWVS